jgi:multidrug efflux system outer membrane protein
MRTILPGLAIVLVTTAAAAQGTPPPAARSPLSIPPPPVVSDPMLTPVPPARRVLASWDEAAGYLRSRSTDLRIALDGVLQAEALTRVALAAYLPTIQATGTYRHDFLTNSNPYGQVAGQYSTIPVQNVANGNVALQQSLINVQTFDQIGIDRLSEAQARLSVEDKKRTLALGLANQLVAVVTAERGAEINRVGLQVALEQAEITRRKQALGAVNGLDVVRAQQNVANARATLVRGDETLREVREALGLAIGFPEETGVVQGANIDGLAAGAIAACKAVPSIDERADVAGARKALEVAKRGLRNTYFAYLPTLNASSTLAASTPVSSGYPNPTWNIQGILSVPIWDGGARYGNLRNARAVEDSAAAQLEAARRQALIEVQQAQRQLVVAEDQAHVAREQRDLADDNDRMTQMAYTVGQGTSLELVTASEAHRQAELNLALQEFGVVKARILAVLALATCDW